MAVIRFTCFWGNSTAKQDFNVFGTSTEDSIIFTDSVVFLILHVHVLNFASYPQFGHFLPPLIVSVHDPLHSLPAVRGNKARWFHVGGLPEVSRQSLPPARDTKHLWGKVCAVIFYLCLFPFPFPSVTFHPPPLILSGSVSYLVTPHTYTLSLFSLHFSLSLLQWLKEEAVHLPGPADGLHQPQAARLQTERGAVPPTEKRAGPTDHGEIWDQHKPAGERLVTVHVWVSVYVLLNVIILFTFQTFMSSYSEQCKTCGFHFTELLLRSRISLFFFCFHRNS